MRGIEGERPTGSCRSLPERKGVHAGKVNLTQWLTFPAVRRQFQRLGLDHDKDRCQLVTEALNLLFENYEKSLIA